MSDNPYTKEWLHRKRVEVQMALVAMPEHVIGERDPSGIKKLKEQFNTARHEMDKASQMLYILCEKEKT